MYVEHDGIISIATGRSRKEKMWHNSDVQWSDVLDKLKETLKGTDTAAIKADTEALTQAFYAVSEKLYQQANPQGGAAGPDMGAQGDGGAQQGQYYDADYKVVDEDDQNK